MRAVSHPIADSETYLFMLGVTAGQVESARCKASSDKLFAGKPESCVASAACSS